MAWGKISTGGRTKLHIIRNNTMMANTYEDEMLRSHVVPYVTVISGSLL